MNLFLLAEVTPPILCRILARKANGRRPMTIRDIAEKSGLRKSKVALIAVKESWSGIAIDDVVKFAAGCGVDLTNTKRNREFLRHGKKIFVSNAPPAQRRYLLRLAAIRSGSK